MAKSLFLCSRMDPFRVEGLRASLASAYGPESGTTGAYHLIVENNELPPGGDARPTCARALQSSDAVLLLLDGTPSTLRDAKDAPVLELEVMLAAVGAKPILLFKLLTMVPTRCTIHATLPGASYGEGANCAADQFVVP